jgi:hypothetical protein
VAPEGAAPYDDLLSGMDDGEEENRDAREDQDETRRNPQQSEI